MESVKYVIQVPIPLPDMYARSPRATDPGGEGKNIRQSTSAHVITKCHTSGTLKICLKLDNISSLSLYNQGYTHCDCGILL